jgi:phosphate transport system substrate-binding protein
MKSAIAGLLLVLTIGSRVHAQTSILQGSATLQRLGQTWVEAYNRKSPEFKLQVLGDGNEAGFAALKAGKVDIVNSSRHITYKELASCQEALGASPREYKVGSQGVAVYVHASNPVHELTLAELRGIFTGKITNWRRLGGEEKGITVYISPTNSAAYEIFKDIVLEDKEILAEATSFDQQTLLLSIAKNKAAIGFGNLPSADGAILMGVKRAVSSTPVEPSEQTITDQTYPISGYIYHYVNPKSDQGAVKNFVEWIRSAEGQQCLKPLGFYGLPEKLRVK